MDPPDSPASRSGVSPLKAFLIILALIILSTVIFLMAANSEGSPEGTQTQSNAPPDFSLTDEEAIARFEELSEIADRAGSERDVSLLDLAFAEGSPMAKRARRSISELLRTEVFDRTRLERVEVEVVELSESELLIREVRRLYPCFETESGEDVSKGPAGVEQEGLWTIRLVGAEWLIWDAALQDDRVIGQGRASCDEG